MTKTTQYAIKIALKDKPDRPVDTVVCLSEEELISQLKRMVEAGIPIHAVNEIVTTTTNVIEEVTHIKGWQLCYDFQVPGSSGPEESGSTGRIKGHQTDLYDFRTGQGMLDTLCGVYGEGSHWLRPIVTEALPQRCDVLDPQVNELPRKGFAPKPASIDDEDDEYGDRYKGKRARGEPIRTEPTVTQAVVTGLGINDRQRLKDYFTARNYLADIRQDRGAMRKTVIIKIPQGITKESVTTLAGLALPNINLVPNRLSFETC